MVMLRKETSTSFLHTLCVCRMYKGMNGTKETKTNSARLVVVIARFKPGEPLLTLEIIGVSAVGVSE
jgi:hypothetical protein